MTQEDKDLLLKDLCARLPYGVRCSFGVDDAVYEITGINPTCCGASEIQATHIKSSINGDFSLASCKPYLFPLSSMTEEQKRELRQMDAFVSTFGQICFSTYDDYGHELMPTFEDAMRIEKWLNKNHFDYRGLIPKGLAIDATGLNIY